MLLIGWLSSWNERYIQRKLYPYVPRTRWLSSWNERYIQPQRGAVFLTCWWLSSWNERYIQQLDAHLPADIWWLSSWNERYIQLWVAFFILGKGGYHLEMKGISNFRVAHSEKWVGGYHLEMKGISNCNLLCPLVILVVIILKWKVYPTSDRIAGNGGEVVIILKWKVYPTHIDKD